jgi:hypothetical protein
MPRCLAALLALLASASIASAQDWPTRPDPQLTPGTVRGDVPFAAVCATPWGKDARHVTPAMRRQVIAAYHADPKRCPTGRIELDHLISRELLGADAVQNLWPECYETVERDKAQQAWGAHKKDRLENELHRRVCAARSPALLAEYQRKIAADWIALYREIFGDD